MQATVAWGITGAGALLDESIEAVESLVARGVKVTAFVSRAGETVLEMYGLKDRLEKALVGDYPVGVVYESRELPGYPTTGRLYLGVYTHVVVSPATMNTVSKIVHGIADSLVSALAMHALKTRTPLYVLPVDAFPTKSKVPITVDREKCSTCTSCKAALVCPTGALREHGYFKVAVNSAKCTRCYLCLSACPQGAVVFDKEIVVQPHPHYLEIVERLRRVVGIHVIHSPLEVVRELGGEA